MYLKLLKNLLEIAIQQLSFLNEVLHTSWSELGRHALAAIALHYENLGFGFVLILYLIQV